MDINIEIVLLKDMPEIVALGELVNEKHVIPDLSAEGRKTMRSRRRHDIEETINSSIYQSLKAVLHNEIVGYIAWRNSNYIAQLYVKSEYQGRGIGKQLVGKMLIVSQAEKIELKSSKGAVGFYKKLGFNEVTGEQNKDGVSYVPLLLNTSTHS